MSIEIKKTRVINDGLHNGKIVEVERRQDKHDYTDYHILLEDGAKIKHGVPTDVYVDEATGKPQSKHARLLSALGFVLTESVDPKKAIGMKINVEIRHETSDRGSFAKVVDGSIKKV
ncbi:MAG: hypothetical protein GWO07_07095 [Candidatus Dadabacteria bacterium]|nr:hypothetical protein [Candidatus Dadabacteria bacterium]NIS08516.1 hypothetical protein [Candidatus Dadabacteria bacterium]NIV12557.1 hypothetical protein [Fodinibius sp.]NIY22406.1 hypothetical protein [Candidatus Dadabacteria bacterium]